jgi:hypothetical protein
MEILITNTGKDPIEIEYDSWSLKEYQDAHRAADFTIQCSRRVPIQRYAHVVATEDRRVLFRGYVQKPKIKNLQTRELSCKGEEDLLLRRNTGRFAYQASAKRLIHAFQSEPPSQTADAYGVTGNVGLLFMANSMIPFFGNLLTTGTPDGDWYLLDGRWMYRLDGLGTDSRIGSKDIYYEGLLLPRVATYTDLAATIKSCYSDASDLYVRCDDFNYPGNPSAGFGPLACMMAENAYDTGVRMGIVDLPDTILTGNLQLNFDRTMDVLVDLAEFYGLNPRYRRGRDCTYMDFLDAPTETEFTLSEENIAEITQSYNESPRVHALIGLGYGSRDCQNIWAPTDHAWKGIWIEDTIDVDEGYIDEMGSLRPYVQAEYDLRQADEMFTVSPSPDWGPKPKPNDMIRLRLKGEAEKILQVASSRTDSKGGFEIEIGGRKSDLVDAFNAKDSLNRVYFEESMVEFGNAITVSGTALQLGDNTHGGCSGASGSFTVPAAVFEADYSHRVTLDLAITSNQSPVDCTAFVTIAGGQNYSCQPKHYLLGDSINGLDITRLCNYGAASTLAVWVVKNGEWSGAACINHPTFDISCTVRCWKRSILGADIKRPISKQKIKYAKWSKLRKFVITYAKK